MIKQRTKNILPVYLIFLMIQPCLLAQISYDGYERLLKTHVHGDRVDYQALLAEKDSLFAFTTQLSQVSPLSHPKYFISPDQQLAYWINAYNAFILKIILENYPLSSIKDIKLIGFTVWLHKNLIGGQDLSFKELEDDIIRDTFKDPRIHFAINCASYSCPPLAASIYKAETLSRQMDTAASEFINNPQNFSVDDMSKTIRMSSIFNWYDDDFYDWLKNEKKIKEPHLLDFIKEYYNSEVKKQWYTYELEYFDYNWQLNDYLSED